MPVVIVAIPEAQDRVHKVSSEKVPHLTMMYLGDDVAADKLQRIVLFVEHVASQIRRFYLTVDHRGELGENSADVLFFEKGLFVKELKDTLANLLANRDIYEAYSSTKQFPEWTPHLTLGYPTSPAKKTEDDYGIHSVHFDRIAVWTGDYDGPEFRLKGWDDMAVAAWSSMHRDAGAAAIDRALAAIQEAGDDDALQYGVKGMKWGVRNASSASDAKTMVERGVAAGGYIVKGGYTSGTVTRAKNSGDLKKLSDSPRFKGKDIRADKTLQKEYRRAVEKIFQKYETRGSRAWRHFETTTDAMYLVALPVRVLTHDAVDPIEIEMVGLNLDAEGHVTTFRSDIIEHANEDGITFFVEVDDVDTLHFGIKGMKWGVRRSEKQLEAARANADPDAIKAVETQAKISAAGSLNVVSSKDLQQLVSRIELEKKYIKATLESSPTTKKGSSLISKAIGLLGREVAMKAEGKDGPLLTGYKALKAAREKKLSSALEAAQAAKAAKDERDRLRKVQKEREKQAAYNSPSNRNRHPGPRVSTDSPADRRTARAERVYNVTTLNAQGNPLALPRGRN